MKNNLLVFVLCGVCFLTPYIISSLFEFDLKNYRLDYLFMFYGGMIYRHVSKDFIYGKSKQKTKEN